MFQEFLKDLHGDIPAGYGFELRRIPGPYSIETIHTVKIPGDLASSVWHHSVFPRKISNSAIENAGLVFCDTDGSLDDPSNVRPKPTMVVHSGRANGYHLYWKLRQYCEPLVAVRLWIIACAAFDGDRQVCRPQLTTRIPGSANTKHMPPKIVTIVSHDPEATYEVEDLEERLVAACIVDSYIAGERHRLTLALAAVLARAGWPIDRAIRTVRYLYDMSPGSDLQGKLSGVRSTYTRLELGEPVSAIAVKDALGKERYQWFLEGLGITAKDGDLIIGGLIIGKVKQVERDVTNFTLEADELRAGAGRLLRWNPLNHIPKDVVVENQDEAEKALSGGFWKMIEEEELPYRIFETLSGAKYVRQGDEVEYEASAKVARNVGSMVKGSVLAKPIPDSEAYYLPLLNGTLDLRTLELQKTTKEHHHRWIIPAFYDPTATAPSWEKFIAEAVPDQATLDHMQEWMGYVLMSGNRWQRMLWLHGPSGTGKSTFIKAIKLILGPAATVVSVDKFDEYSVAQLATVRVAMCTELSPSLLKTSTVKSLVSGDPVRGRHPYGRPFDLTFTGKLVWGSNELPPLDQGQGMWRRIVPVPMYVSPSFVDHGLDEKLRLEVGGILNWAIVGLKRLVETQLPDGAWPLPTEVQDTIREYETSSDTIVRFGKEEIEQGEGFHLATLELYQRYVSWAQERSMKAPPLGPRFYGDCRRIGLVVDPNYSNGMGPHIEYMKGGRLRPGIFGSTTAYAVNQN